jgi:hypothetical protein
LAIAVWPSRASGSTLMLKARNRIVGYRRTSAGRADIHFLAGEIGEAVDVRARQHVHLLRTKPRDDVKPFGEVAARAFRLGAGEHVGRNKTRIDMRVMEKP